MSQENVEFVRRGFEAINRGEIETIIGTLDPDVELVPSVVGGLEQTHFRGPAGYRAWFEEQLEIYEVVHFDLNDVRAIGDQVVALYTVRVRARQSGIELESARAAVLTIRDGLLVTQIGYQSQSEALEAVGLREEAMASANLDLVRSIYADWERGDFGSAEWAHPDIEWVLADGPAPGTWTGRPAMAEANRDFLSAWEAWRVDVDEYRELDQERVLVFLRFSRRGKASGMELSQMRAEGAELFHVRGGKVTRFVMYMDRERALAELGLAPEAGSEDS